MLYILYIIYSSNLRKQLTCTAPTLQVIAEKCYTFTVLLKRASRLEVHACFIDLTSTRHHSRGYQAWSRFMIGYRYRISINLRTRICISYKGRLDIFKSEKTCKRPIFVYLVYFDSSFI